MKYGGMNTSIPVETAESLLYTANCDFISVLILWYNGIMPGSTYVWMMPHSLEKYLKSYLVKGGFCKIKDLKKFGKTGHGLKDLWKEFKKNCNTTTSKPKLNQAFDDIVDDLNEIEPRLRYSGCINFSSDLFLYFYITLASYLRYLLIGKSKYRTTLYGLDDSYFLLMNNEPICEGYGKTIIRKMLHIALEHGGMFTNMGFINCVPLKELSISNTAIFESISDCPVCQKQPSNQIPMIKFYRDINPKVVATSK